MRLKINERDILDEAIETGIVNVLSRYAQAVPKAAEAINDYGIVVEFSTSIMNEIERRFEFDCENDNFN